MKTFTLFLVLVASVTLTVPARAQDLPAGPGRDILQAKCTACHSLNQAVASRLSAEEWNNMVMSMVLMGAEVSDDERPILVEYLAKTFPEPGAARPKAREADIAASTCPTLEVDIVVVETGGSNRAISWPDGKTLSLAEKPLLTIGDFSNANVSLTEGQIVLNLNMTPESAARMQAYTASHVGQTIAFLANGRIIKSPRIVDPITGSGFLIGPFARDEAQKLADSINHKESACTVR